MGWQRWDEKCSNSLPEIVPLIYVHAKDRKKLVSVNSLKCTFCKQQSTGLLKGSKVVHEFKFFPFFTSDLKDCGLGESRKYYNVFQIAIVCMKSINSVFLGNGRGKNI